MSNVFDGGFRILLEEYRSLGERIYGVVEETESSEDVRNAPVSSKVDNIDIGVLKEYGMRIEEMIKRSKSDDDMAMAICEMLDMLVECGMVSADAKQPHLSYQDMLELTGNVKRRLGIRY